MSKRFDFEPNLVEIEGFEDLVSSRGRTAIYPFLEAVYRAAKLLKSKKGKDPDAARAIISSPEAPPSAVKPIVRQLIDLASQDSPPALRSKWARALRYCLAKKIEPEHLVAFMKGQGGINGCANLWAERQKRLSET